jgi:toxin HigB-1
MMRSFNDARTARLVHGDEVRELQAFTRQADKRLRLLDAADTLRALQMLPSNQIEAL